MNKLLIAFMVFGSLFSSNLNKGPAQTPLQANDDPIVEPSNYLNLGAADTDAAWITKQNPERPKDSPQVRNPIIFFNANPKYQIDHIKHINYRVKDVEKNKAYHGTVSYDETFTSIFYTERRWLPSPVPSRWPITTIKYEYHDNSFVKTSEVDSISDAAYAAYTKNIHVSYPEMGKTSVEIKALFSLLGQIDENIPKRVLWEHKTSKEGYKNYNAFNVDKGSPNFKYYLILPLESTNGVVVDYLSLEAYDVNGNLITDVIDIEQDDNFDPNPNDPNSTPLQDVYKFLFIKEEGKLKTSPAVYFPGSNKFKLVGIEISVYQKKDDKNYPVYLFAGDLVGKKTMDLKDGVSKEWKFVGLEKRYTTYEFQGTNNSLLIDIPIEVTDITYIIYYQKINIVEGENLTPFAFNLTDNEGNFGVRGETPLDDDPNKRKSFWEWFKDLFSFDKDVGIFGSLKNILGTLLISLIVLAVFVLVVRLIRYRPRR
jgi:hypothetical protein